ncbi:MAG: class I adenylate-forming enzyme family protein [Pseudomonadota bacterium]
MHAPTNLGALVDPALLAPGAPARIALIDTSAQPAREWTYPAFDALCSAVARGLERVAPALGLARGDRIAILAANSAEFLATACGIMRAGFVCVPVNYKFPQATIDYIAADCGAKLLFCDRARAAQAPTSLPQVRLDTTDDGHDAATAAARAVQAWLATGAAGATLATGTTGATGSTGATVATVANPPSAAPAPTAGQPMPFDAFIDPGAHTPVTPHNSGDPREPAIFLYTSGSTGRPKGVVLSHASHLWVTERRTQGQSLSQHRVLVAAPLYHMNGLAMAQLSLRAGSTLVLMPQFDARAYIDAIERYRCTWLTAVPPMLAMMLQEQEAMARADFSSVRIVRMGSAPVSDALLERIHAAIPQATLTNGYGTTECAMVIYGPHPRGLPQPAMSVGYPNPAVQLRLVDGENVDAEEGVLQVKTPAVMNGYHGQPEATRRVFTEDGYYITGDIFRRDADGFHTFVGRADDMFVCGGENIYPGQVEKVLEQHPAVEQACCIPVPDDIKGTKPVAFVIPKAGAQVDEDTLKRHALALAPAYMHPRRVWIVEAFPLAGTNKIDRKAVTTDAMARLGEKAAG